MAKRKQAIKVCYAIMPFSDTDSCSAGQWTTIFNGLIKPAVEEAGLGYTCVRSKATTGNIIKKIVQHVYSANVVIADLTDKKPNVFYELGVRHTLRQRTILIAQSRDDIPSDLDGYSSHEYDWNTEPGQVQFRANIRDSLQHIEEDPDRSDNPVSDFLQERSFRILEFQREENSRKLRALIWELELLHGVLKEWEADEYDAFRHSYPALDHLIGTQYVNQEEFCRQAAGLRSLLEIVRDEQIDAHVVERLLRRVRLVKENALNLLVAYESGDSLSAVKVEEWKPTKGEK